MAQDQSSQERTESPTTKRREDARLDGMVAMSREVPQAALLGTFALFFWMMGQFSLGRLEVLWKNSLAQMTQTELTPNIVLSVFLNDSMLMLPAVGVLFALVFAVGLASTMGQVGIVLTPLRFHFERLDPITGFGRILSMDGLAELVKAIFKMVVIGYVTYVTLQDEMANLLAIGRLPLPAIFSYTFGLLSTLLIRAAMALVILAVLDYLYQRWSHEQRLKMTKQEMREELRQTEGDPQLRSRIRTLQREMSRARMMQNVPKADVVVTNPTHYAIALQYDREVMHAPRVIAKGADFIAERIKAIATENKITMVENVTVARELYNNVEIGQEIPEQFFRAVAEILAFVYRLKGRSAESRRPGAPPPPPPRPAPPPSGPVA
jgi:flagellar biosynthesis protein FlhB